MSNYATPDPGIIDRPYVQQIPLEALFKNLAYKQSKYDQGLQQAKQTLQAAGNINAYGQDEKVRDEMFKKLNTDLEQFNGMDLGDTRVSSQLDGLVSGFTDNGEIAGIDARGRTFAKMQKEEEAAQMKGLEYYNPGLDQARKYYAEGAYKSNTRFSDDGNIAPDMEKINKEILADPAVSYKKKDVVNGYIVETTVVDKDKAAAEYKRRAQTDPRLSKYVQYKFNAATDGTDWKVAGIQHFEEKAKEAQEYTFQLQRALNLEKDPATIATYQAAIKNNQDKVAQYRKVAQDPHMLGTDFKSRLYDEYISEEAERYGLSKELNAVSDIDSDPMAVEQLRHQNDMTEASMAHQYGLAQDAAKNALERGYGYNPATKEYDLPLEYNPGTPSKSGRGKTSAEVKHFGKVLREKYEMMDETKVRAFMDSSDDLFWLIGGPGELVKRDGNWFFTPEGKEELKNPIMTADKYVNKNLKNSKATLEEMEQDTEEEIARLKELQSDIPYNTINSVFGIGAPVIPGTSGSATENTVTPQIDPSQTY